MGYLRTNAQPLNPQDSKYFTKFPLTAKFMKWEIQGNCFSVTIQRLSQTVATAVAAIFDLIALPFRAALFFFFGFRAGEVTIIRNPSHETPTPPTSESSVSSSSSSEENDDVSSLDSVSSYSSESESDSEPLSPEKFMEVLTHWLQNPSEGSDAISSYSSKSESNPEFPSPKKFIEALTSRLQNPLQFKNEHQYNLYNELVKELGPQLLNSSEWSQESLDILREFMIRKHEDGLLKLADPEGLFAAKLQLDLNDSVASSSSESENDANSDSPKKFIEALVGKLQNRSQFTNDHEYNLCEELVKELGPKLINSSEWDQESLNILRDFIICKHGDGSLKLADPEGILLSWLGLTLSDSDDSSDYEITKELNDHSFMKELNCKLQNNSPKFNPQFVGRAKTPQPQRQTASILPIKFEKPYNLLFNNDSYDSAKAPNYISNYNLSSPDDSETEFPRTPSSPSSNDDIDDPSLNKPSGRKAFTPPLNPKKKSPSMKRTGSYPSMKLPAFSPKQAAQEASCNDIAYNLSLV